MYTGIGCLERLWSRHSWRYSNPNWSGIWTHSSWPCLSWGVGVYDLMKCLQTSATLWSCEPKTVTRGPGANEVPGLVQSSGETWVIPSMLLLNMRGAVSSTSHGVRSVTAFLKAINTIHSQALHSAPIQHLTVLASSSFPLISDERCPPARAAPLLSSLPATSCYLAPALLTFSWDQTLWEVLFIAHEVTPCPPPCFSWFPFFCLVLSFTRSFHMQSCFDGNHYLRKKNCTRPLFYSLFLYSV